MTNAPTLPTFDTPQQWNPHPDAAPPVTRYAYVLRWFATRTSA